MLRPTRGWHFTGRQGGKTLQDLHLVPGTVQVTIMNGAGGGVAYARVVNTRNADNELLVATATRLAQGPDPD